MKLYSEGIKKHLVLLPVVFLLLNAFLFENISLQIQDTILNEKRIEIANHAKMLAAAVDTNKDRPWINYEPNLIKAVEYLDLRPWTFASLYKRIDGEWKPISTRYHETSLEPFDYIEFHEMIAENYSGHLVVLFSHDGEKELPRYFYFQYLPMHEPLENKYLVVTAVSEKSDITPVPMWVSAGQWISTLLTFLLNVILVVMLVMKKHRKGGKQR